MSRFNSYAKKLNETAKKAFEEYRKAEKRVEYAKQAMELTPYKVHADAEYTAKMAANKAEYEAAKVALNEAHHVFNGHKDDIKKIREALEADINSHYAANPAAVDTATLELMKSGILRFNDYERLMASAKEDGNYTMMRLVGKYADEKAERIGATTDTGRKLRALGDMGANCNGNEYLQAFDMLTDVYNRSVDNPAMIDHWDSLTNNAAENF